ncbi:NDP-hexose-3-ketoreductase [Catenuloplanes nepalensis]|uniref:NDP-hexose-3-ketoreductase n=1 Tax=Catenuloplanes nepalensis TaxID=587533 RepID=A0ABT9MZH5_9ACTN|nr:Gfo/Idh/MocA family oxidoreductase [Catenuloplanes nepalensis]MDP9796854.1 NDP-hexose-3-ketoreductase [Catenuloplanes nepalensis]
MPTVEPIRFGVLGCASIARRRTVPAILREPRTELVAVAARDPARARTFAAEFGCDTTPDYLALLARPDIDAVYIPLPTGLHHEWVGRALEAGKHVLVEKPLTTRYAHTVAVLESAAARGLTLMENLTFLRHGLHRAVRELVDGGEIGELRSVSGAFSFPPLDPADIRYRPELGGGALLDIGVYPLSAAHLFLGPDLEVVGATLKHDPARGVDISGSALLCTPDGRTAQLTFGFEHAYRCDYVLWGSKGRLVVDRAYTPPPTRHPTIRLDSEHRSRTLTVPPEDQFANTLHAFADAITTHGNSTSDAPHIRSRAHLLSQILHAAHTTH